MLMAPIEEQGLELISVTTHTIAKADSLLIWAAHLAVQEGEHIL